MYKEMEHLAQMQGICMGSVISVKRDVYTAVLMFTRQIENYTTD